MTKLMNKKGRWLTTALAVGLLAGCGGPREYKGKKYDPGRVLSGTVTWEGKPVDKAGIELSSAEEQKGKKRSSPKYWRTGPIENSKYTVSNLEPGKYRVKFVGFLAEWGYEGDQDPKVSTIDITEDMHQERSFDLHAKKKKK
jgi:hypothetical protein